MKKSSLLILIFPLYVSAQKADTGFTSKTVILNEVIITATKTPRLQNDIPGQNNVIPMQHIQSFPINNIDDILKTVPNIYVNRSTGIFSRNSSVTMRGSDESSRTLILIDGVPKNKMSGGAVNWAMVNVDQVKSIEITKGPVSALYGNNAMSGVINILTKDPVKDLEGMFRTFYGSYQTIGGAFYLGGKKVPSMKKLYWSVNGFYRQGNGINIEDQTGFDPNDTTTYLREYGGSVRLGYQITDKQKIDITYDAYNEIRGAGIAIFEEDGSYDQFLTQMVRSHYQLNKKGYDVDVHLFWQNEYYYNQSEAINNFNEYKLIETFSDKDDEGILIYVNKSLFKTHAFTFGTDIKSGGVDASDVYRTSPDKITYTGRLNTYALFVQDEFYLMKKRFSVITGLRLDRADFVKGSQTVENPSTATGFLNSFNVDYEPNSWINLSPKIALQYNLGKYARPYISFSTGFRPAKIDDLCKSGKISKGFRLANPELEPETVFNYEAGFNYSNNNKLRLNFAGYFTDGQDYHYLVATGATYESADGTVKPVFRRENVANVHILGMEINSLYHLRKNISFFAGLTYNHSVIAEYQLDDTTNNTDLTGMQLMETSPYMANAGITWENKYLNASVMVNYFSSQYLDEENTISSDPYTIVGLKLWKDFLKHWSANIDVQNLFDVRYIDRKGRYSLGRFITGGISYKF